MPSSIHRLILAGLGAASCTAILLCEMVAPAQIAGLLIIAAWALYRYRLLSRSRLLIHHGGPDDTLNHWTLVEGTACLVEGTLIHKGYRSAGLLVLAIRATESNKIYRIPVWRDSVPALDYSYLTLQLFFNTADASSRSQKAHSRKANSHVS